MPQQSSVPVSPTATSETRRFQVPCTGFPPNAANNWSGWKDATNGGDPAVVESAAIATATQKLDQIRTNGNLTQDQENAMVNGLKAFYDAVMNGNFRPQPQPQSTGSASI